MTLAHEGNKRSTNRRLVGVCLFLAMVFLPLHTHALAENPKVTKECSCLHGTRTEVGLVPVALHWTPPINFILCELFDPQVVSHVVSAFQAIRAPPAR